MRIAAWFLLAALPVWGQSMEGLLRYADPAGGAWVGVEWAKIAGTPHAGMLRATFAEQWADTKGLEFIERLDRLLVSATPAPEGTALLMVIEGTLDLGQLRDAARKQNAQVRRHKSAELLLAPPGGDSMDFAILSPGTVALGDRTQLAAAVDRAERPLDPRLERVREIAQRADVWSLGSFEVFSEAGASRLIAALRRHQGDALARQMAEAIDAGQRGGALELAFSLKAPEPPRKLTIRIHGLETGPREIEFR